MKNTKFLIVDDEEDWAEILANFIELCTGLRPVIKNDGLQAIEYIKNQAVDVIFTDTNMPRMNGIELLNFIKKTHPGVKVVVFFEELYGSKITRKEVLHLGADAVLKKDNTLILLPDVIKEMNSPLFQE
jgi:two-component system chemotaxis response regulator CheY